MMNTTSIGGRSQSRPRTRPTPLVRQSSAGSIPLHPPSTIHHQHSSSLHTTRHTSPHRHSTAPLSSSALSTSRSLTRSTRDAMLEEFTSKFLKTKNDLHARNQQCELLAVEIEKLQKELITYSESLEKLELEELEVKERFEDSRMKYINEADKHKSLTHELTQVRKEKQERIKERAFLAQEHSSYQLACQQIYEDSTKHEENAKNLSKKLQVVNKERLKYRHECLENQERINEYNNHMYKLQTELQEMREVVFTSIGDSFVHTSRQ